MPWFKNIHGDDLWYEEYGAGTPLVLIHGWCMSSAVWFPLYENLSKHFKLIVLDLRGHGNSSLSSTGYGFDGFAADVLALFDHLKIEGAILTGWSLGAQVVLKVFQQLREKIFGIVLVSGTPRFAASEDFPQALNRMEAEGMAVKVRRNIKRALDGFSSRMFASGELDEQILASKIGQVMAAVAVPDINVALESLDALVKADMRSLLDGIDLPTLIIHGDQDVICLPEASAYMAQCILNSQHLVFKGCGHAPFLTKGLLFETALKTFSRRLSERSI